MLLLTRAGAQHDVTPYLIERFGDAYSAQIEAFVHCLQTDRVPMVGGEDALAALAVGVAATQSEQSGQPVTL